MKPRADFCPTEVLSDAPTTQDSFSHSRVAIAIADVVLTAAGGKAIGLTGTWGSGKSTVVELLRTTLKEQPGGKIETFVFDAWAHQGDPLRRAFLEQLIDHLVDIGWLSSPEHWKNRKDDLARRVQKVTTKTRPTLTPLGAIFAALILLAPVGLQLVSKYDHNSFDHPYWAGIGFAVAALPFLFAAGVFLFLRPTKKFWEVRFWSENREKYRDETILALFFNRTQERTDSTTLTKPDPTSVEFQSMFSSLLQEALGDGERRLVIVADNLDRVDSGDALEIWATMKAFFDLGARRGSDWLPRLWLLVPFDPTALRRLWPENNKVEGDDLNGVAPLSAGRDGIADSFADKTFQLTFRVSPPLLSDWSQFFIEQLKIAFPSGHDDNEFHKIYRLYDLKRLGGARPPTPRDIKLFVNRVGVIHRQWPFFPCR